MDQWKKSDLCMDEELTVASQNNPADTLDSPNDFLDKPFISKYKHHSN